MTPSSHSPRPAPAGLRSFSDLDSGWTYARQWMPRSWLAGRGRGGEPVSLPHSVNADDTMRADRLAYRGWASYRRPLCLDPDPRFGHRLELLPFFGRAHVCLDGRRIARCDGQYLGAWLDLGAVGAGGGGERLLGIRVDNSHRPFALPCHPNPDFVLHGGLSGGARLWRVPLLHVVARAAHVRYTLDAGNRAELVVEVPLANQAAEGRAGYLEARLYDPRGELVAASAGRDVSLRGGERRRDSVALGMADAELWSPERPALYTLEITLWDGVADTCDQVALRIGLRTLRWTSEGLLVNGEHCPLHGVNRHDSMPGFGNALPRTLQRRDAELAKEFGANCLRLVHYPHHPEFLDACDELGLFVYPELASWDSVNAGPWLWAARRQLRALVERDRNRPSVMLWGLGNESRSRLAYWQLDRLARKLDPERATGYAENRLSRARRAGTARMLPVYGLNYELGRLEQARRASRQGTVLVTECMNVARADRAEDGEAAQLRLMGAEREQLARHPWLAGYLVWSLTDYATEHRGRVARASGLFDAERKPRLGAYLFRAWNARAPFVFVDGDWGRRSPAPMRLVTVITNLPAIEVHSGAEVAIRMPLCAATTLELPFTGAPLEVRAVGNAASAAAELRPWDQACALRLSRDRAASGDHGTPAWARLEVVAVDEAGERVGDFAGRAQLQAAPGAGGPLRIVTSAPLGVVELRGGRGHAWVLGDRTSGAGPARLGQWASHPALRE